MKGKNDFVSNLNPYSTGYNDLTNLAHNVLEKYGRTGSVIENDVDLKSLCGDMDNREKDVLRAYHIRTNTMRDMRTLIKGLETFRNLGEDLQNIFEDCVSSLEEGSLSMDQIIQVKGLNNTFKFRGKYRKEAKLIAKVSSRLNEIYYRS